jgi:hypothetical protein
MSQYEDAEARHTTFAFRDGSHVISIRPERRTAVSLFMLFWLGAWTVGGFFVLKSLLENFHLFLLFWLGGWVFGELFALSTLCWLNFGAEVLRVSRGDLEVSATIFGLARRRLYKGTIIRDLQVSPRLQTAGDFGQASIPGIPFFGTQQSGRIKFTYGAKTVFIGPDLDEAEAALIVEKLRPLLPRSVLREG